MQIAKVTTDQLTQYIPNLITLLQDVVEHGASVGFLPPLSEEEARAYWMDVAAALRGPHRIMLIAHDGASLLGTVQLDLASRTNASHRAEVIKLMVHPDSQRRGIGRALMQAIEAEAKLAGRTTLILDTRLGDPSERLYTSLGYVAAGTIPNYARSADGSLHATVLMYKLL